MIFLATLAIFAISLLLIRHSRATDRADARREAARFLAHEAHRAEIDARIAADRRAHAERMAEMEAEMIASRVRRFEIAMESARNRARMLETCANLT